MRKKTKTEQAEQSAAPIIDEEVVDSTELATIEPANAEIVTPATYLSVDTDEQVACMRDMAGMMLKRWKKAIEENQEKLIHPVFNQEELERLRREWGSGYSDEDLY